MKHLFLLFSFSLFAHLFAQTEKDYETVEFLKPDVFNDTLKKVPWSDQYREDQFYFGITHDVFLNNPKAVQNNLSIGLSAGFLRDMPFTKNRKFAFAPGVGINYKRHNTFIYPDEMAFYDDKLSISQWSVELPIELRWRNSTLENSSFFRCHVGTKFSYRFAGKFSFNNSINNLPNDLEAISPFVVQNYIALGYSLLNVYVAYSYQPFYKNSTYNGQPLNTKSLSLGFIFYIL